MSYIVNPERLDIKMSVVRTFRFQAETEDDPRDNMACVELQSDGDGGRYSLVCSADDFSKMAVAEE